MNNGAEFNTFLADKGVAFIGGKYYNFDKISRIR